MVHRRTRELPSLQGTVHLRQHSPSAAVCPPLRLCPILRPATREETFGLRAPKTAAGATATDAAPIMMQCLPALARVARLPSLILENPHVRGRYVSLLVQASPRRRRRDDDVRRYLAGPGLRSATSRAENP
eukprot:scaffold5834_cov376-Prasinococcus_capsulatus_cf.AAC.8